MIPFTPDERRAEFAPSQNQGGPVDPDVLAVIGQPVSQEPAMSQPTIPEPVDPDVLDIVNRNQVPLMSSLMSASRVNPDQAAEASRLGARIGVGQDVALRNLDEVRQRAFMADMQARDIARTNPVLASFLMDRTFANQASDDVGTLEKLAQTMDYVSELPSEFMAGFRTGRITTEAGLLGTTAQLRGKPTEDEQRQWNAYQQELADLAGDTGFWRQTGELLGQIERTAEESVKGAVVGGGVGAGAALLAGQFGPQIFLPEEIVTVPAATIFGMGAGAISVMRSTSGRVMAGNNYMKNLDAGMDPDVARVTALGVGLLGGALEAYGLKLLAVPFKGMWSRMVMDAANEAVTRPTVGKAIANFGTTYAKGVGGEIATEVSQQVVEIAFDEMGGYISDPEAFQSRFATREGRQSIKNELTDVIVRTALGVSAIGGIGPGINLAIDLRRAKAATTAGERIQQLVDRSKQLKLRTRNPDAAENIGNQYGIQSGIEQFYVDAKVMRGVMEQAGLKPSDINAVIPGLADRIATEAERGGDVTITPGQLIARIAGTPFGDAITPHLRVAANALSVVDAQAVEASRAEIVAQAEQLMEEKQTVDAAFVQSAQAVEDSIFNAVKAVGYSDVQARTYAKIHQAMAVVDAAAMGITPEQFYERYPYRVRVPQVVQEGQPLEQADQFDQAGQRRTDTPQFRAWSNNAQLVTKDQSESHQFATGVPVVVEALHGSIQKGLRKFDVNAAVEVEGAIFFSSNEEVALQYTFERAYGDIISDEPLGEVISAYVSFQNPMVYAPKGRVVDAIEMSRVITQAKELGHDGVIIQNIDDSIGMTGDMGNVYVTWNPTSIKSTDNSGAFSRATADIYNQAATIDADYLAAVERGDMESAQRMVDEAARASGYIIEAEHQTNQWFSEFKAGELGFHIGTGIPEGMLGQRTMKLRARITNPLRLNDLGVWSANRVIYSLPESIITDRQRSELLDEIPEEMREGSPESGDMFAYYEALAPIRDFLVSKGYDGIVYKNEAEGNEDSYIAFDPKQLKSADPVTRDEAGNVVPPSRRFDITSPKLFEQAARIDADYMAAVERGDMATAQRMADEAARAAGYTIKAFHGSASKPFWVFDPARRGERTGSNSALLGFFASTEQRVAREYQLTEAERRQYNEPSSFGLTLGGGLQSAELALERATQLETSAVRDDEQGGWLAQLTAIDQFGSQYTYDDGFVYDTRAEAENAAEDEKTKEIAKYQSRVDAALQRFQDEEIELRAGRTLHDLWVRLDNPLEYDFAGGTFRDKSYSELVQEAIDEGHDGVIMRNTRDAIDSDTVSDVIVFFKSNQAKLADAVTRDEAGNVVPLSRRFDITSPKVFEQAARGPARGGHDPRTLTTVINKGGDITTLFHELIHYKVEVYLRMANAGEMPAQQKNDLDELFKFMGVAGATFEERLATYNGLTFEQRRPLEEQITYNFEDYLLEGRAPSLELRGVFDRIAAWMRRVYKSLRDDLNAIYKREFGTDLPILTPEIRAVFDRMLASEEQIKRAEAVNNMKGLFQTQAESGMDDATWAAYQAMQKEATDEAIAALTADTMKQVEWMSNARSKKLKELQKAHDTQRKEVRDQVMAEVRQEPIYRAMEYLKRGTLIGPDGSEATVEGVHKINTALAREFVPGLDMAKMGRGKYGYLAEDGLHPDIVAEMFGFPAGSALLQALADAKPMREVVDARTDEIMVRDYSEMGDPKAQEAAVNRAIHNEARARLVAVEARWLSKATQPVRVIQEAARQAAVDAVGNTVIRNLRPDQYAAAEARASRDAIEAARGADTKRLRDRYGADATREQVMLQAKRQQLYQNALATEAQKADDAIQKGLKYLRRVLRDSNRQRMGADYADQITGILDRFELAPISRTEAARRADLAAWVEAKRAEGLEPDIDPEVLAESNRRPWRNLTVTEFNAVMDAVKQIEFMGKNERKIKLAAEKADFEKVRDEIVTSVIANAGDRKANARTATTNIGRAITTLKGFIGAHLKAASIARILDGAQDGGPVWNYLIRSANDAGDKETTMRAQATERLTAMFAPIFKLGKMGGKGQYFPSVDRSFNREARLVIALNMGNDGNIQRLLDGEGWSIEQITPILQSLTEEEWNLVQQVWDYFETYRPEIAAKERELYGKEPNWVEPKPMIVQTADGKTVTLRGGYYPIKYDPRASMRAETMSDAEAAKRDLAGAFTSATTRRSYTKSRVKEVKGRPLLYTLAGMYGGVNEVIHDLSWHRWLIQANRLMRSQAFDEAVREKYGPEFIGQLKTWIKDVAAGERGVQNEAEMALNFLRQGISSAGLGFNVVSAALQITGFNQSIVRVGVKWIGRGIAAVAQSPLLSMKMVNEKSDFMANRSRTQFRELNELRNMVQGDSVAMRRIKMGTYFLMMRMQRMVDVPTWIGAYEKALYEGRDEDTSIALADQAVIDSQGGGMLKDLSRVERGGAGLKLFTVFYGYMNTVYNMAAVQTMTAKNKGKLAADYAMLFVVPVVLGQLIRKAMVPKTEDEPEDLEAIARKLAAEQLSYLMGTMVIVREFGEISKIVAGAEGPRMGYGGPAGLRAVGETYNFATQASQGEFDKAFRKSAVNLIGAFTGLPSAQINRTLDGLDALYEGETENVLAPATGVRR
jgi:hypothetical protein